jgi:hypothetical protein
MNKTEQLREENQSRRLSSKSGVAGSSPAGPTKNKGECACAGSPPRPEKHDRESLNAGNLLAETPGRLAVCVDCRAAPAGVKGRCDACRQAHYRRQWLARKSSTDAAPCVVCGRATTGASMCKQCTRRRANQANVIQLQREGRLHKPKSWRNLVESVDPPAKRGKRIAVRTVRFVETFEPDDPARASAVDAILARRRAITRKGAR